MSITPLRGKCKDGPSGLSLEHFEMLTENFKIFFKVFLKNIKKIVIEKKMEYRLVPIF